MNKTKNCEECGNSFFYERISAKFCSDACKQQAYLRRSTKRIESFLDAEDAVIEEMPEEPIKNETIELTFISEPEEVEAIEYPNPTKADKSSNNSIARRKRRQAYSNAESKKNDFGLFMGLQFAALILKNASNPVEKSDNVNSNQTTVQPIDLNTNETQENTKEAVSFSEMGGLPVENAENSPETLSSSNVDSNEEASMGDLIEIQTDFIVPVNELSSNNTSSAPSSKQKLTGKIHSWFKNLKLQ